jgi:ankyrin repeat protein
MNKVAFWNTVLCQLLMLVNSAFMVEGVSMIQTFRNYKLIAACSGADDNDALVYDLIQNKGADLEAKRNKETALMIAVQHNNLKIVEKLISLGADVNAQTSDGLGTVVHYAVWSSNEYAVRILLNNGVKRSEEIDGELLLLAIQMNVIQRDENKLNLIKSSFNIISMMITEYHFNLNYQDHDGRSALHVAAQFNLVNVIRLLLENHASTRVRLKHYMIPSYGTPLMAAIHEENFEAVKILVENDSSRFKQCPDVHKYIELCAGNKIFEDYIKKNYRPIVIRTN